MKMSLEKIASKGQQRISPPFIPPSERDGRREEQPSHKSAQTWSKRGRDTRDSRLHGWSDHTTSLCNECASQNTRTNAHTADIDTDSREQASERASVSQRARANNCAA